MYYCIGCAIVYIRHASEILIDLIDNQYNTPYKARVQDMNWLVVGDEQSRIVPIFRQRAKPEPEND